MTLNTAMTSETLPKSEAFLANVPLQFVRMFYPLGFPLEIATNDEAVFEAASASWGHLSATRNAPVIRLDVCVTDGEDAVCPPTPVVRLHGHLLTVVADADNQGVVELKSGVAHLWLSRSALQNTSYIRYHFIEAVVLVMISTSFVTPLHAACVGKYGQGMLLCGDSGAGKSTLAYACARAGWTYTSDDSTYLIRDTSPPHVVGSSRQIRFRPTAVSLFSELEGYGLTPRAEGKPSIEIGIAEILPGVVMEDEANVHLIVFLKRDPFAPAELISISIDSALERLNVGEGLGHEMEAVYSSCIKQLSNAQCFELQYSELDSAVECLDSLAREAAHSL
jgi:hypothetical protein